MCAAVVLKLLHRVGWHRMLDFKPIKCFLFNSSKKRLTLRFSNMPFYFPRYLWSYNMERNSICLVMSVLRLAASTAVALNFVSNLQLTQSWSSPYLS